MLTRTVMIVMIAGSEMDTFVVKVLNLIKFLPELNFVVSLIKVKLL